MKPLATQLAPPQASAPHATRARSRARLAGAGLLLPPSSVRPLSPPCVLLSVTPPTLQRLEALIREVEPDIYTAEFVAEEVRKP